MKFFPTSYKRDNKLGKLMIINSVINPLGRGKYRLFIILVIDLCEVLGWTFAGTHPDENEDPGVTDAVLAVGHLHHRKL